MHVKAIAELVVHVADLVEAEGRAARSALRAEGRALREEAGRFTIGMVFLFGAAGLVLIGACLCVGTVYTALEPAVGASAALLGAGVSSLTGAAGLIWLFKRMSTR